MLLSTSDSFLDKMWETFSIKDALIIIYDSAQRRSVCRKSSQLSVERTHVRRRQWMKLCDLRSVLMSKDKKNF